MTVLGILFLPGLLAYLLDEQSNPEEENPAEVNVTVLVTTAAPSFETHANVKMPWHRVHRPSIKRITVFRASAVPVPVSDDSRRFLDRPFVVPMIIATIFLGITLTMIVAVLVFYKKRNLVFAASPDGETVLAHSSHARHFYRDSLRMDDDTLSLSDDLDDSAACVYLAPTPAVSPLNNFDNLRITIAYHTGRACTKNVAAPPVRFVHVTRNEHAAQRTPKGSPSAGSNHDREELPSSAEGLIDADQSTVVSEIASTLADA